MWDVSSLLVLENQKISLFVSTMIRPGTSHYLENWYHLKRGRDVLTWSENETIISIYTYRGCWSSFSIQTHLVWIKLLERVWSKWSPHLSSMKVPMFWGQMSVRRDWHLMLHVVGNTINTFHSDVFIKDFCRSYQCMMRSEWEFEFPPIPFQVHKTNFTKRYLKVDGSSHLLQEDIRKLFFGMAGKIQEAEDFTIQLFLVTGRREELNCFSHFTPLSLDMVRVDADLDSINNCRVPELHRVVDGSPVVALGELLGVSPPLITDEDRPRLNPFSDKRNKLICSAFLSDKKTARLPRLSGVHLSRTPTTQIFSVTSSAPRWFFHVWRWHSSTSKTTPGPQDVLPEHFPASWRFCRRHFGSRFYGPSKLSCRCPASQWCWRLCPPSTNPPMIRKTSGYPWWNQRSWRFDNCASPAGRTKQGELKLVSCIIKRKGSFTHFTTRFFRYQSGSYKKVPNLSITPVAVGAKDTADGPFWRISRRRSFCWWSVWSWRCAHCEWNLDTPHQIWRHNPGCLVETVGKHNLWCHCLLGI